MPSFHENDHHVEQSVQNSSDYWASLYDESVTAQQYNQALMENYYGVEGNKGEVEMNIDPNYSERTNLFQQHVDSQKFLADTLRKKRDGKNESKSMENLDVLIDDSTSPIMFNSKAISFDAIAVPRESSAYATTTAGSKSREAAIYRRNDSSASGFEGHSESLANYGKMSTNTEASSRMNVASYYASYHGAGQHPSMSSLAGTSRGKIAEENRESEIVTATNLYPRRSGIMNKVEKGDFPPPGIVPSYGNATSSTTTSPHYSRSRPEAVVRELHYHAREGPHSREHVGPHAAHHRTHSQSNISTPSNNSHPHAYAHAHGRAHMGGVAHHFDKSGNFNSYSNSSIRDYVPHRANSYENASANRDFGNVREIHQHARSANATTVNPYTNVARSAAFFGKQAYNMTRNYNNAYGAANNGCQNNIHGYNSYQNKYADGNGYNNYNNNSRGFNNYNNGYKKYQKEDLSHLSPAEQFTGCSLLFKIKTEWPDRSICGQRIKMLDKAKNYEAKKNFWRQTLELVSSNLMAQANILKASEPVKTEEEKIAEKKRQKWNSSHKTPGERIEDLANLIITMRDTHFETISKIFVKEQSGLIEIKIGRLCPTFFKIIDLIGFRDNNATNPCSSKIFAWQSDAKFDEEFLTKNLRPKNALKNGDGKESDDEENLGLEILQAFELKDADLMRELVSELFMRRYEIVAESKIDQALVPVILETVEMSEVGMFALAHAVSGELLDQNMKDACAIIKYNQHSYTEVMKNVAKSEEEKKEDDDKTKKEKTENAKKHALLQTLTVTKNGLLTNPMSTKYALAPVKPQNKGENKGHKGEGKGAQGAYYNNSHALTQTNSIDTGSRNMNIFHEEKEMRSMYGQYGNISEKSKHMKSIPLMQHLQHGNFAPSHVASANSDTLVFSKSSGSFLPPKNTTANQQAYNTSNTFVPAQKPMGFVPEFLNKRTVNAMHHIEEMSPISDPNGNFNILEKQLEEEMLRELENEAAIALFPGEIIHGNEDVECVPEDSETLRRKSEHQSEDNCMKAAPAPSKNLDETATTREDEDDLEDACSECTADGELDEAEIKMVELRKLEESIDLNSILSSDNAESNEHKNGIPSELSSCGGVVYDDGEIVELQLEDAHSEFENYSEFESNPQNTTNGSSSKTLKKGVAKMWTMAFGILTVSASMPYVFQNFDESVSIEETL